MDRHTFIGKRKIGSTDICDFTDYQGLGHDPLYKRYESVNSIVKKKIKPEYAHFLSAPDYSGDEDSVNWFIEEWNDVPERLVELTGEAREKYEKIKERTLSHYRDILIQLSGEELQVMACALRYIDDEFIYCCDDKVYVVAWGMTPDTRKHIPKGELVHESPTLTKYKVSFDAGDLGTFRSKLLSQISLPAGTEITARLLPDVTPRDGYLFTGWIPNPIGRKVESDMSFSATYEKIPEQVHSSPEDSSEEKPAMPEPPVPQMAECRFNAGENGEIQGKAVIHKIIGSRILPSEIPLVNSKKGYEFKGWNVSPTDYQVRGDAVFDAVYEKKMPWYRRTWLWLTGNGCLKWLLWLLLGLLLALLLLFLLRGCKGCTRETNGVSEIGTIVTAEGDTVADNGVVHPIDVSNGRLPEKEAIVAPVRDEEGNLPPIVRDPGVPPIISNRLFLFLESENDDIDSFATDFKKAYPGDQYRIIGYDREVKSLLIQIPEAEREEIRRTINSRIPNHQFLVFDEELYELNGRRVQTSVTEPGWHLKAVDVEKGWEITKGDASVVVAVVDDGIQASHPMFNGRIVNAYNVFTQDNRLSVGEGHGTHTAGLAVGSSEFLSRGASGIAPNCKLMPIQVLDNGMCPLSALVSGVMYAIHKDADVVNISIGPSFSGLNQLPVELQNEIAQTQFKNLEKLWTRVCKIAADKNTILVFAAGNDDILSSIPPENRTSVAITVGAVDQKLYPTDFTNYGPCTDISAPGKEIYSSFPTNDFQAFDGTSMAAPIVSGTIALMKSLKKDLTVREAYNVLYNTGKEVYGFMPPMVQVSLALEAVKRGDFKEPETRRMRPVPIEEQDTPAEDVPASWINSAEVIEGNETSEMVVTPDRGDPALGSENDDYEAIRRLIAKYKQKIIELEGQLPENKKK